MNRSSDNHAASRRFTRFIILVVFAALTIGGCGQKGPLYRTDTQQEQAGQ